MPCVQGTFHVKIGKMPHLASRLLRAPRVAKGSHPNCVSGLPPVFCCIDGVYVVRPLPHVEKLPTRNVFISFVTGSADSSNKNINVHIATTRSLKERSKDLEALPDASGMADRTWGMEDGGSLPGRAREAKASASHPTPAAARGGGGCKASETRRQRRFALTMFLLCTK